jgi:S1-C subfamily serine protease
LTETKTQKEDKDQKADESVQKELFNLARRGVVAIDVTAHVIVNQLINEKLWHGTGFIVDVGKGLVVTNAHIAGDIAVCTYRVKFGNGKTAEARIEYIDAAYDFAILSVEPKDIPDYCIALKCSETPININSSIFAMGNSGCNEFSTYPGCVFDTESILWLKPLAEQSFQFSGLTVGGASGSPVFNNSGEVVGVLYGGKIVSGAALPISYIVPVIKAIKNGQKFSRYFSGLILNYTSLQDAVDAEAIPIDAVAEYEKEFPKANNKIVFINDKLTAFGGDKSPAMAGDIIWAVNGVLIGADLKKIDEIIHENPGKNLMFTVFRDGVKKEYEVPVHELSPGVKKRILVFAGVTFFETTDDLKISSGKGETRVCVIDSEPGSPFAAMTSPSDGRYSGGVFIIVSIDGKEILSLDDLWAVIPSLLKKKVFTVHFNKLGCDPQKCSVIMRYNPEFANATFYKFDQEDKKWSATPIK